MDVHKQNNTNHFPIGSPLHQNEDTTYHYVGNWIEGTNEAFRGRDIDTENLPAGPSPWNEIPPELLAPIMKMCIPPSPPEYTLINGRKNPRLRLTQVCQRWRNVAFSIAEIWNILLEKIPTRRNVNLIAAWFRQCSSAQIYFGGMEIFNQTKYTDYQYLLKEVLIPNAHRFHYLNQIPLPDNSFGTLQFDTLYSFVQHPTEPSVVPFQYIVAPSLRRFGVEGMDDHLDRHILKCIPVMPWEQLTDFYLTGNYSASSVYDVLSRCISLETFRIDRIFYDWMNASQGTPLHLPHLRTLYVVILDPTLFDKLFMFAAPNLSSLSINHPPNNPEFLAGFATYMQQVKSTLRKFESLSPFRPSDFASVDDIARAMPFIESFHTHQRDVELSTIQKIMEGELLPNLKVFELDETGGGGLEDVLNKLFPIGPPRGLRLQEIIIGIYHKPRKSQRLIQLQAQGLNVRLTRLMGRRRHGWLDDT